ncbi:hypothetical protein D1BOALGB6SA_2247 [Olavius sp. associated proteobacterium Delta 1]|nr:hypothetical protein D1BOALGB6SA_2247 [Olavius sp. associated proteobacterium Delta 1]
MKIGGILAVLATFTIKEGSINPTTTSGCSIDSISMKKVEQSDSVNLQYSIILRGYFRQ